jgi:hypothetical protein
MITIILDIINKILNLVISKIDANKQQVSQDERNQIESDPAVFFSNHFDGLSDVTKHNKDNTTPH